LEWFKNVKREFIYEIDLYKVLYNQIDITELVKLLELNSMKDPGVGGIPILKEPGTGGGAIYKDPGTGS
jgi:hypothetical protein